MAKSATLHTHAQTLIAITDLKLHNNYRNSTNCLYSKETKYKSVYFTGN